jgi:hypothetical protein
MPNIPFILSFTGDALALQPITSQQPCDIGTCAAMTSTETELIQELTQLFTSVPFALIGT